jgi:hypothetical protein
VYADLFYSEQGGDGNRQYASEQHQIKPLLPFQKNRCDLDLYILFIKININITFLFGIFSQVAFTVL